jgi:hypothetical protein
MAQYTWKTGVTGSWTDANNWTPEGFSNQLEDICIADSGVLQASSGSRTFNPSLTLNSEATISIPTDNGIIWTVSHLFMSGGSIDWAGGNSSWAGIIEAVENTTSIINAYGQYGQNSSTAWSLSGSGNIIKTGTSYWTLCVDSEGFSGIFIIDEGTVKMASFTRTFNGKLQINEGGIIDRGSSQSTWTIVDGINLNGGKYLDSGNNGTVYTEASEWSVSLDSIIEVTGPSTGNRPYTRIDGSFIGNSNITINTTNNNRGVSFKGTGSFSGTIIVQKQSYLYLGSNVLSDSASIIMEDSTDKGLITIGCYRTADTITNVANVNIVISSLSLNGTEIEDGVYDQSNQDLLGGYIVFNNETSSLTIQGTQAESPIITISSYTKHKISSITGMDVSVVTFQSNQDLQAWEARADGNGHGQGDLVGSGNLLTANTDQTFDVEDEELTWGDKTYRITVYGQNTSGVWSDYET